MHEITSPDYYYTQDRIINLEICHPGQQKKKMLFCNKIPVGYIIKKKNDFILNLQLNFFPGSWLREFCDYVNEIDAWSPFTFNVLYSQSI